jgi:hypothetical protein
MQIRYTARPEDVGALLRYSLRHSPRLWLLLLGVCLFSALLFVAPSLLSGNPVSRSEVAVALSIGLLAAIAVPLLARRRTKSSERVLTVAPDRISTTVGPLSGEIPWRKVAFIGVTDDYIFIGGASGNGMAIPRRAFASDVDRAAFTELVRGYHAAALSSVGRDV